jgi:hypothetical protein
MRCGSGSNGSDYKMVFKIDTLLKMSQNVNILHFFYTYLQIKTVLILMITFVVLAYYIVGWDPEPHQIFSRSRINMMRLRNTVFSHI